MLKNYFKITIQNIKRRFGFSLLNIIGLSAGIATCLMIMLFVNDELSYDKSHKDVDQLYRVALERTYPDRTSSYAAIPMPVGLVMEQDFPEVIDATQLTIAFPMSIRYGDEAFQESEIIYADSSFFEVFGIEPILGDQKRLLTNPNSITLTPETARKYFGDEDPIGKQLELEIGTFTVTGIVPPMPSNSHFHYDFVASLDLPWLNENDWLSLSTTLYVKLEKTANPEDLESKLPGMVERYAAEQIQTDLGVSFDEYRSAGNGYNYFLQPVSDIHLYSNLEYEFEANGNITYIYLFSIIALMILIIAGVNFVNLTTAQAISRAKEVGVRKTLGSQKIEIITQFLLEAVLLSTLSLVIAILMVNILLPYFNHLTGKTISALVLVEPWFLMNTLLITLLLGISAGIYPAFFLSGFEPSKALKGRISNSAGNPGLRKTLVVFQFTLSIMLLAGTSIVLQQIDYVFNKNLGFDKDQRLVIEGASVLENQQYTFMQALNNHSKILNSARSNGIPGLNFNGITLLPSEPPSNPITAKYAYSDDTFLETYGIEIIEGRKFSRGRASDSLSLIVNESMAKVLGEEDVLGKSFTIPGDRRGSNVEYTIVGVMEDFHHESLHKEIGPVLLRHDQGPRFPMITLHLDDEDISSTIAHVENVWNQFSSGQPLSYFFFDQHYNNLYESELKTSSLLSSFTGLSFILTCLGLFGLSAYAISKRRKEIGIRKVLGASVPKIIVLLTKDYFRLVLIAFLIASPIAYYATQKWLVSFTYRIDISIWPFVIVGALAFLIALVTIGWQSVKAALSNPVESLKSE